MFREIKRSHVKFIVCVVQNKKQEASNCFTAAKLLHQSDQELRLLHDDSHDAQLVQLVHAK